MSLTLLLLLLLLLSTRMLLMMAMVVRRHRCPRMASKVRQTTTAMAQPR